MKPFDLESVYDNEIAPLMAQIIEICKKHEMPMVASFNYRNEHGDEDAGDFCTTAIPGGDFQPATFKKAVHIIRNGTAECVAFTITKP